LGAKNDAVEAFARFQRESSSAEVAAKLLDLTYSLDVSSLLSDIVAPTLILHREGDKVVSVDHGRDLAAEIRNAHFEVLKGRFHFPWLGESDEIIDDTLKFLGMKESKRATCFGTEGTLEGGEVRTVADISEVIEQATIVFSDIVSSTDLVIKVGDAVARDMFLKHDRIVRDQIEKHGGRELQNLGDGFMLSFESATTAIKCACKIQKEVSVKLPEMRIRMGINTGDVVMREGNHPFGQAVVLASRVASQADGGEILVSDITRRLVAGSKFPFAERGEFKPKGFDTIEKIHEVLWRQ
jgi:class 3 adenylate cyclase